MDINQIRKEFPILNNSQIVYFDNSSTSHKPNSVIKAIAEYYENYNSNVNRGLYPLATKSTEIYEEARKKVAAFINAQPDEIIFVSSATDGLNSIARSLKSSGIIHDDSTITVTHLDHHSNILPWQQLTNQQVKYLPVNISYGFDIEEIKNIKTDVFSFPLVSNVTGTIFPIENLSDFNGIKICDATQAVGHIKVDVKNLDVDFLVFSAHKMYGPMGIGVVYAKKEMLDKLNAFNVGGGMIHSVEEQVSTYTSGPERFEAGTPNVASAYGLQKAIEFIEQVSLDEISIHEQNLKNLFLNELKTIENIDIYNSKDNSTGVISFSHGNVHAHDIAQYLGDRGVCVRAGHHCTQILHKQRLNIPASVRVSFGIYNTEEEVKQCIGLIKEVIGVYS